ncbi:hypothetical protein N7508_005122 [Penicillium antarcticum]|uniref:uncharacterized protein n=1 Tax=Penicillium antarcticum TaxID=416450 RepID=UPI0023A32485|nr:uncharacterized protein N7508_005122 [Penicillium antarcticum]KAJ5306107.1 hypothetical protein N7508_005122 [Penicillium antarcticum]
MTSPSTPRSTRSASPGGSPNIITPGQKIKAMMAEFDSDSDDDTSNAKSTSAVTKLNLGRDFTSITQTHNHGQAHDSEDSSSEDEVARPKGRMAARMQGNTTKSTAVHETESAFARVSKALRSEREQAQKPRQTESTPDNESSEDDLPAAGPRRKNNARSESPESDNEPTQTPPRLRSDSPLFVSSPAEPHYDPTHSDDNDTGAEFKPKGNSRFLSLVAQKRKEREEREKAEAEKKAAARKAQMEHFTSEVLSGEESGADDPASAHKLSQKARQPRKASKKALDEMRQETQRMSRNMQLAHQAKTKKKITKESLFARFNFMQPEPSATEQPAANSSSTAGSQNSSDGELRKLKNTPQTSPVFGGADEIKTTAPGSDAQTQATDVDMDEGQDLPTVDELVAGKSDAAQPQEPEVKQVSLSVPEATQEKKVSRPLTQPPIRVLLSRQAVAANTNGDDDSDSDLEVVTSPGKCRRIAAFENLPTRQMQEDPGTTRLKALAHLTSPSRKRATMNNAELSASLLLKARQQAAKERRERIDELRAKGVVIETAEERAAMEDDMENLVEKARKEADEIARLERAAKNKNGQNNDDDEDEDDDYQLSGSDEEAYGEGDDEDEEEETGSLNGKAGLVEQEADEDDESADDESEDLPSDTEKEHPASARRKRRTRVISDDEDEEDQPQVPSTPVRAPSHVSQSAERPKFPGLGTPGDMSLGLTQAFASTLDGSGAESQPGSATIPFFLPDPGRPTPQLQKEESEVLVPDSQEQPQNKDFMEGYSQSITRVSESPAPHNFQEYSQLPDPTQDEGFVFSPFDPAKRWRDTPPASTIDTVLVNQSQSPIVERKRKMLRRGRATELSQVEEAEPEGDFEINANAFDVMKKDKATKKQPAPEYNKKSSKAKDIVDEAAEESEDEYAGLGGHSDDSDGEEDAIDRQMINDNSGEVVDEKQLAALNAVHDRNRDEKDVAKLMRDITTGALRRRKNANDDFDLDDSDDEHLARRREKQREFAKMRRALLADEKIGEIAENPKKAAFFKAVEDREIDDDFNIDFLEEEEGGSQVEASQDTASEEQLKDASAEAKKRKRPLEPSDEDSTNRPPPNLRRTPASAMSKKPATLAEIRETLSFLTETPEYDSFHEDASLDEDGADHEEESENTSGAEEGHSEDQQSDTTFAKPSHPRRTRGVVVDRLALLRQASSNSATNTSGSGNGKMAFSTGNSEGPIGFRPPQLLRRVTTGSSSSSNSSTTSNRVPKAAASGPKKGGAVNSYTAAREREREKELRIKQRNGGSNIAKLLNKHTGGGLGALGKGQWD